MVRCYQDTTRLLASRHCSPGKLVRTLKTHLGVLIFYNADIITISSKSNLFSPRCSWGVADLALDNNKSLTRYRSQKWQLTFFFLFLLQIQRQSYTTKRKNEINTNKVGFLHIYLHCHCKYNLIIFVSSVLLLGIMMLNATFSNI